MTPPTPIILVTGLSGAGKSHAMKALEDLGYEAIDNLPLSLLPALVDQKNPRPLAIGVDVRSRAFSADDLLTVVAGLRADKHVAFSLLFMTCEEEILQRRFTETRRRHPLAVDRPVVDGIRMERSMLNPVRAKADIVLDTTDMNLADLKLRLREQYSQTPATLAITVMSFSFRQGVPREADMVFDVRFLRNPYYDPALKDGTGKDAGVGDYIAADPDFQVFFDHVTGLLLPLLPRYLAEGKSYLTIAFGCTGGRHRSVYNAEKLAGILQKLDYNVTVQHRDVHR